MREHKYRAWDKKHNKMILTPDEKSFFCLGLTKDKKGVNEQNCFAEPKCQEGETNNFIGGNFTNCPHLDWMQYTGLKDKNGKEIYEGDLLDVDAGSRIVKVVWFQPQACFDTDVVRIIDKTWPFFSALKNSHWNYRCEVIGNIYVNKEVTNGIQ